MKLLIVDDNPNQLYSLETALKTKGHSVICATSGEEGLRRLTKNISQIDAVLTDYAMPGMTGMELLTHVQRAHQHLPVIMMTGNLKRKLVNEAVRNGCRGLVEKPFTLDELMKKIEDAISKPDLNF